MLRNTESDSSKEVMNSTLNPDPTAHRARILLVEDHPDNRKLVLYYLHKYGYECEVAMNGEQAVKALSERQFHLVLMDCQMPVMDGYQATAAVRRLEGDNHHTPIIAMTAQAIKGGRARCSEAGMDDYVSKPLSPEKLMATIRQWVLQQERPADVKVGGEEGETEGGSAQMATPQPITVQISRELEDMVPGYLSNRRNDLLAISKALETNDIDAIRVIGHGMKGSGGGYGFSRITEIGADLERAAKENNLSDIQDLKRALADYVERVEVAYQ